MTTCRKQYTEIKTKYTNIALDKGEIRTAEELIILFQVGNRLEAFYEDARKISQLCNKQLEYSIESNYRIDSNGDRIPFVSIPFNEEITTAQRINQAGYKFTVIKESRH